MSQENIDDVSVAAYRRQRREELKWESPILHILSE